MLPEINGMEICKKVRGISDVPTIMVTARDEVDDKVLGLDSGADNYLTKPYAINDLTAILWTPRTCSIIKTREVSTSENI